MIHSFWSNYALQKYKIPQLLTPSSLFVKQKWSELLVLTNTGIKQVPHCSKCLQYSCTGYSVQGLHYTQVTFSSGIQQYVIVYCTSNLALWNPAACQSFEEKSPDEAVLQAPSSPEPWLPGSTSQLWGAEATAEHGTLFQHLFPFPDERGLFYFWHN